MTKTSLPDTRSSTARHPRARSSTRRPRAPATAVAATTAVLSALFAAGCSGAPLEPQTEGCTFDTSMVGPDVILVYEETGGIDGRMDRWIIRDDGSVTRVDLGSHAETALEVAGGAAQAAALGQALEDTGLRDEAQGCYEPAGQVYDAIGYELVYQRAGELYLFAVTDGTGTDVIDDAIRIASDYVAQAH